MRWDRVLFGGILVTVGVLFLLDAADVLSAGETIADWWPVVLIAVGIVSLADRPTSLFGPLLLIGAGGLLLLFTLDVIEVSAWNVIWPLALILAGAALVFRAGSRRRAPLGEDSVRTLALLSGSELRSTSSSFEGAKLTAILGGAELDMREASLASGGAEIEATAILGGVDLIVPRTWRVTVRGTPILGGISNKAEAAEVPPDAPTLQVDALAFLGGVDIKHEK